MPVKKRTTAKTKTTIAKKKATKSTKIKTTKPHCGVTKKVISEYGICEVACTPSKKKKCGYHKSKK